MRRFALSTVAAVAFLCAAPALAQEKPRPELAAIADAYAADGDLDKALAALRTANATPRELLATLRERRRPTGELLPGKTEHELQDGNGKRTKAFIVAPSADALAANAGKGLGLVVSLHGLGGSASQELPIAEKIAARGDVVCIAPTAQRLKAKDQDEQDGIGALFKSKHWWSYDDPKGFVFAAIEKARALYPIDPDRVTLSGMSMGGYGTWNNGLRRPDRFAGLAPLAGGISRLGVKTDGHELSLALLENARNLPILSVHGDADSIVPYDPDREACDHLKALGAPVTLRTLRGVNHDLRDAYRGEGKPGAQVVEFVSTQRRKAPEAVTFVSVSDHTDGAYWVRITERVAGSRFPRVEAKIDKARNAVTLRASGVAKVRVYLDERLLDLARPVTVRVGDAVRWSGDRKPDHAALLESWRSRRDEGLVYPAYVEVDPRP